MSTLPIVERELRVAARKPATVWIRFFAAVLVVMAVVILLLGRRAMVAPHQTGLMIFHAISTMAFAFCLLAGTMLTADALSSEKREGTLGLLFLTDLKGYDVVLGKLAATSVQSIYGLLAALPMIAMPLLMGGITFGMLVRLALVLLVTMFLSLSIGLLVSALVREMRQALALSLGFMLVLAGLLPLAAWLINLMAGRSWLSLSLALPSPVFAFRLSQLPALFLPGGLTGGREFWISLSLLVAMAVSCLLAASIRLPRVWIQKDAAPESDVSAIPNSPSMKCFSARRLQDRLALEHNPFFWLAGRGRTRWAHLGTAMLFLLWLGFFSATCVAGKRDVVELFITTFIMAFAFHALTKIQIAVEASRRLSEDRLSGALELLLVTPLKPRWLIAGQIEAVRRHFAPLLGLAVLANLALTGVVLLRMENLQMGSEEIELFGSVFVGGIIVLFFDFFTLTWVSMWVGLHTRHHQAVLRTLIQVMLPPWVGIFLFISIGIAGGLSESAMKLGLGLWFAGSLAWDIIVGQHAKQKLRREFRNAAAGATATDSAFRPRRNLPWRAENTLKPDSNYSSPVTHHPS